jgi:hypothetical protein
MELERMETATLAAELRDLELKRQRGELAKEESRRHQTLLNQVINRLSDHPEANRRKYLRIPADLEARFRMGEATITCGASELSLGGLSLRGHLWVIEDQELVVENLKVGNKDYPMTIRAKIVWKVSDEDDRPRAGLQFVGVDDNSRYQVHAIFEQLFLNYLEHLASNGT